LKSCRKSSFNVSYTLTFLLIHIHPNPLTRGGDETTPFKIPLERLPVDAIIHNMAEETINFSEQDWWSNTPLAYNPQI